GAARAGGRSPRSPAGRATRAVAGAAAGRTTATGSAATGSGAAWPGAPGTAAAGAATGLAGAGGAGALADHGLDGDLGVHDAAHRVGEVLRGGAAVEGVDEPLGAEADHSVLPWAPLTVPFWEISAQLGRRICCSSSRIADQCPRT